VSDANTRSSTAACAACFAGEIACVQTSNVERNEECRSSCNPVTASRAESGSGYCCHKIRQLPDYGTMTMIGGGDGQEDCGRFV